MQFRTSSQIRAEFLDFFSKKNHAIVPSAPVVPHGDPTLLFTNAGMNQFKPLFLGEQDTLEYEGKQWKRAADTQKCIRVSGKHNDLEEVGIDTYHHTLFEMLGNWSFGDYFKEEAISWAWELLVDKWGLTPDRLYATVFGGDDSDGLPCDDEAIELWKSKTSIAHDHILKFGKKDNFWEMGETGPCGPCSEIHVDLRSDEERAKQPGSELVNADDPRVMEIWNLVFIQFNRQNDGELKTLPAQHVDTGMGFERICAVLQGKTSNYDSDVFMPMISAIAKLAKVSYGADIEKDIAIRVISDHIRAVSFSIADGASPSNDGRGYVIRRILRRAIRYGWDKLGLKQPFMYKLVGVLADQFKSVFPELKQNQNYIESVIEAEENSFLKTLGQGISLFNQVSEGKTTVSGADAFKLHDTYGFPIDLTSLMARERGLSVDEQEFTRLMDEQKKRARAAGKFTVDHSESAKWNTLIEGSHSEFIGYDSLEGDSALHSFRKDKDFGWLVFRQTPFYAESGGQVGDSGIVSNGDETLRVLDVQKANGMFMHKVERLPENVEGEWFLKVDNRRRKEITKHHSATHLVHAALRETLGGHVAQKGSLVNDEHLRFDFSHFSAVSKQELDHIEQIVNENIQANIPLDEKRHVPIKEAQEMGATMLFGEKYGDLVRVITFDPTYSMELCGGTHVNATGEIGYFRFLSESSVASGVRRITALVGGQVDAALRKEKNLLAEIEQFFGKENPIANIESLIAEKKALEKELEKLKSGQASEKLTSILTQKIDINGINLAVGEIEGASMDVLKQLGYDALAREGQDLVMVLGSKDIENGKVSLVCAISDNLVSSKGLKAGNLVKEVAKIVKGGGGGQPTLATAGGKDVEKLAEALASVKNIVLHSL